MNKTLLFFKLFFNSFRVLKSWNVTEFLIFKFIVSSLRKHTKGFQNVPLCWTLPVGGPERLIAFPKPHRCWSGSGALDRSLLFLERHRGVWPGSSQLSLSGNAPSGLEERESAAFLSGKNHFLNESLFWTVWLNSVLSK